MAIPTSKAYRNQVMYSVFVRNYSEEGTFEAVRRDLRRIRELGVDIVWLLPIHPVGEKARKGALGSPYAIRDYRAVNPEYGTLEDFRRLVDEIHGLGMRCIIDVVFNHTSPDSWLAQNHPEWFYRTKSGGFGNKVGEWLDVIDLDYSHPELWEYLTDTLKYWAAIVDGFRCDVAPLIPLEFWQQARAEVEKVRPGCFWLSESVEPSFTVENRAKGLTSLSDSEIFQAFDCCYEYDIFGLFKAYQEGQIPLSRYAEAINQQEAIYPENYVKLRYLENHDNARAKFVIPDERALRNWTAFIYFQKGMTLLYAGQESSCPHLPSLFDKDTVDWAAGPDLTALLRALGQFKKNPLLTNSRYEVRALPHDILYATHRDAGRQLVGIFSARGEYSLLSTDAPDGCYPNLTGGAPAEVRGGKVACCGEPVIFEAPCGE